MVISRHRRQKNPAPAQPAPPSPHPPGGEGSHRIHGSCPGYCREERGCYRTLLEEMITSDIPGYRNFTWMEPAFFDLIKDRITPPPPPPPPHSSSGSRLETGSYFKILIHRGKLHFTAIPLEGWKNGHPQICPPCLQSHFERIAT